MTPTEQKPATAPAPSYRPLIHYMNSGKINWSRISDDDKRLVMRWLRMTDPAMVDRIIELKKTFGEGVSVPYIEIDPKFWYWLTDQRAQERRRQEQAQHGVTA